MTLHELISKVLQETGSKENPYFQNLENGSFSKPDFVETQVQFYYAVVFFSRPMAALAGRIPAPDLRIEVLKNIWEEHGEGRLSHGHGSTFKEFLRRLDGIEPQDIFLRGLWPEIRLFNTTLVGVTVLDDFLVGVAVMGMIERMFSEISTWIGQGVVKRGWISENGLIHYKIHEQLDIKHSEDFFKILEGPYANSEMNRYHIEQGLRMGATLFNGLYRGLWDARGRRWMLPQPFPPSMTADYVP